MNFPKRRYIVNFNDGSADLHPNDCPPAEEYLSKYEHESIVRELICALYSVKHDIGFSDLTISTSFQVQAVLNGKTTEF